MADRDEAGRFSSGNKLWLARSSAGPKPKFEGPDALWAVCVEYFEWNDANPLYKDHVISFQGVPTHVPVAQMRAMTIAAMCTFIDVSVATWNEWRRSRPDLSEVMKRVETVIYTQKFEGASADMLNANIIARELGLADKSELTGKDGKDLIPDSSPKEIARRVAFLLASGLEE